MTPVQVFTGIALLSVAMWSSFAVADARGLEGALRQVVEDNLEAYNAEDTSATLASIHTNSPVYSDMRDALPAQFRELDSRTELAGFTYVGHDDEFAYARVQYRTTGGSRKPFMGNVLDTITVFHQEDGAWKYWDHLVLGVRPTE